VVPLIDGGRTPFQFVHEQDVAGVMATIIERGARGAFNVAGEGWLTMAEVCRLAGRPTISLPRPVLQGLLVVAWRAGLRAVEVPPSILDFMQHPWVLDTRRVTEELGYRMTYSSREALLQMLRTRTGR
jgi:UDP-glucose 4-epimerase